ncbi:hypothetical protein KEM48_013212 [Puccinia striiformis f. sp. tritici PST-130]|nr:hypothetical protein KEM48_013212 [Puccinia striiformis f. sp. tritici PST-130]
MPRHHPILVHKQISASLEYGLLKQPPRSSALINYPPNPTPSQDALSNQKKKNMEPIKWILKDKLRKAFFRDHPFEAYRPVSLVEESAQHLVNKVNRDHSNIDRLDQISCKPSPEDCIEYAERLTLRFEEQIRTSFARQEAEYYSTPPNTNRAEDIQSDKKTDGHVWGRDLIKRSVEIQDKFIIESNAKSTRKSIDRSNSRSALPSKTVDDHNLQNRLIGSRVKNDVRIPIHDHLKFNQSINSELIKKSKRLSTIS